MGDTSFVIDPDFISDGCKTVGGVITCSKPSDLVLSTIMHEYGHVFDNRYEDNENTDDFASAKMPDEFFYNPTEGYACGKKKCQSHPYSLDGYDMSEEFANMYENFFLQGRTINGILYGFTNSGLGIYRYNYMISNPDYYEDWGLPKFLNHMGLR